MGQDIMKVIGVCRLVRDAELSYTSGGMAITKFSVAFNTRKKSGEQWVDEGSFVDVVIFGKSGESVQKYLTKGKQVAIEGRLKQDRWEKDGQAHSKVGIVAENVQLLGGGEGQARKQESRPQNDFPDDFPDKPPEFDPSIPF